MGEKILEVKHLKTYFHTDAGLSKAVNDVSFSVEKGKTLGIVGESGCGKSITSLSIMGLVEIPPGQIAGGEIIFEGEDLLSLYSGIDVGYTSSREAFKEEENHPSGRPAESGKSALGMYFPYKMLYGSGYMLKGKARA